MITLINLPSPFLFVEKEQIPLGLLYLGAVLKKEGHEVEILDLAGQDNWEEDMQEARDSYEMIGMSVTTPQFNTAKKMREIHCNTPSIVGGPQPTIVPDLYLKNGFNGVCRGKEKKPY